MREASSFLTVTVAPAFTGFASLNAVPEIVMSAELPPTPMSKILLLLLQAARPRASATHGDEGEKRRCMTVIRSTTRPAVHRLSRGSPSVRSPMTLRWISFVPAQIELAW